MLPDLLTHSLKAVVVGTAVGSHSASVGYYYANPSNRFWKTLYEVGITTSRMEPRNFPDLLNFGVGLTDLVKTKAGADSSLKKSEFDVKGFTEKILEFSPVYVCFNGKKASKEFLGLRDVSYGLQGPKIGETKLFVAHSTSGANNGNWDIQTWQDLSLLMEAI